MKNIKFEINGEWKQLEIQESWSLLYIIREVLGLTGTKCGCEDSCLDGGCGACVVIVDGEAKRSCRIRGGSIEGARILTIEGVADGDRLHPIQQAFIDAGAVQCGYCIPGMVLTTIALLNHTPNPTESEIRRALSGNLCRCTGYEKIVEAVKLAAVRMGGGQA